MTLPTKILLALVVVLAGSAYADVTATDAAAEKFSAAAPSAAKVESSSDQSAITLGEDLADNETEGRSCQFECHPAMAPQKTALAKINLDKIH